MTGSDVMTAADVVLAYSVALLTYSVALVVGNHIADRRLDRLEPPRRPRR